MSSYQQLLSQLNTKDRGSLERYLIDAPEWVLDSFQCISLPKDCMFIRENDLVDMVYILISGKVKGTEYRVLDVPYDFFRFSPLIIFGAMEFLMDLSRYQATLVTVSPCRLLRLSFEQFTQWMLSDIPALRRQAKEMSDYLLGQIKMDRLFLLSDGEDRIALYLNHLCEVDSSNEICTLSVTRNDLSQRTGLSTRTVSRTISSFVNRGLISKNGWRITINKEQRMMLKDMISKHVDMSLERYKEFSNDKLF